MEEIGGLKKTGGWGGGLILTIAKAWFRRGKGVNNTVVVVVWRDTYLFLY